MGHWHDATNKGGGSMNKRNLAATALFMAGTCSITNALWLVQFPDKVTLMLFGLFFIILGVLLHEGD